MSRRGRDLLIWRTIKKFYKTKYINNHYLEQIRQENQLEAYWCRPKGDNQNLFAKPEQRLMARFIKSYLNTSWHKIESDNSKRVEQEQWFEKPDIIGFIKALDENKNKLNKFAKNACSILLETNVLKNYTFDGEQSLNLDALQKAVNQRYVSCSQENSRLVSEFEEKFYPITEEPYQMILKMQKILPGYGIALTCDFLKESHLCNIAKPDVHLCHVFSMIDRIPYDMDLVLVKRVSEFANHVGLEPKADDFCNSGPYFIDKIIWMLCSTHKLDKDKIVIESFKKELLDTIAAVP